MPPMPPGQAPQMPPMPAGLVPSPAQLVLIPTFDQNIRVLERAVGAASLVEIHEYINLGTSVHPAVIPVKPTMKRVRISISNGEFRAESGALHYMKGHVTMTCDTGGAASMLKKAVQASLTHESAIKPLYKGTGDVYLEPSSGHYAIIQLRGEECVVDKGMFFAAEGTVAISAFKNSVGTSLFGGEGMWQTRLSGTGWVVLTIPVPLCEVHKLYLNDEKLSVDGNFACLRRGSVEFKVEKSTKSIIGSRASGEGLLQTFSGTGEVWVCPTDSFYHPVGAR